MLTVTHGPETCPGAHEDVRLKAIAAIDALMAVEGDVKLVGGWANRPAHHIVIIADAPNAHVLHDLASEIGLADWNTVSVSPVVDISELRGALEGA